jgi:hypothetical protein
LEGDKNNQKSKAFVDVFLASIFGLPKRVHQVCSNNDA